MPKPKCNPSLPITEPLRKRSIFSGDIERLDGDLDAAVEHLHKSIKQMPSYPESHTELGRVHLLQGEIEPARAELAEALNSTTELSGKRSTAGSLQTYEGFARGTAKRSDQAS